MEGARAEVMKDISVAVCHWFKGFALGQDVPKVLGIQPYDI